MSGTGRVLLFKGRGLLNMMIRCQTRSCYSHAALLLPDSRTIIESYPGVGVQEKTISDWRNIDVFRVPMMTPEMWNEAIAFARSQVGRKYDYLAIIRFVDRAKMPRNDRWFCSELVFESLERAGVTLLFNTASWAVAPGHLAWSTRMKLDKSNFPKRDRRSWQKHSQKVYESYPKDLCG
jgi:uncharacterized protein YycO